MTDYAQAADAAPTSATAAVAGETTGAIPAGPFFQRPDWLSFGITATTALAVYLWTLAPDVTLENSGGLAPAAMYLGVPYDPGFPAWTVYSWLFTKLLPFGNIAWRIAVGSAFAAALMCGLVALMVSRTGCARPMGAGGNEEHRSSAMFPPAEERRLRIVCGWVAGMGLALGVPIWTKALIVDIWTFGDLLFSLMLCLLTRWSAAPAQRRYLYWALFIYAVSLTGNEEFIVMAPGILVWVFLGDQKLGRDLYALALIVILLVWRAGIHTSGSLLFLSFGYYNLSLLWALLLVALPVVVNLFWSRRVGSEWRAIMLCTACLVAGLAVSFYLPVAAMSDPPMDWGYPRTVAGFFHALTRGQYDRIHPTTEFTRFFAQLWWVGKQTGSGFGWIYLVPAVLPLAFLWRSDKSARRWVMSLAGMLLCVGPLMIATINLSDDRQSLELHQAYFGAMYVVLAIFAGMGLAVLARLVSKPMAARHENVNALLSTTPGRD